MNWKWIIAALVILAASFLIQSDLLAYAMYTLLTIIVVSRFLTNRWVNALQVERSCSKLVANINDHIGVSLDLVNTGALPIPWVLLEDALPERALLYDPPSLAVQDSRVKLTMLKPNQNKRLQYSFICNRRGYYQLGPTILETGDLFGLHRRYQIAAAPQFLTVYPRIVPLDGYDLASRRPIGEIKMTHRLFEDPTRIAGVRAYQDGDPLNRIHWRATARTGQLHSKIYEASSVAGVTIMMEFHREAYPPDSEPFRSELAVTAATSIANAVQVMGQQIGFITNGRDAADRIRLEGWDGNTVALETREAARAAAEIDEKNDRLQPVQIPTRRDSEQFHRIRETLARVELTDGLTLAQLVIEAQSRIPRDATVLVIIPGNNDQTTITLQNMARRGFAVSVMVNTFDPLDYAKISSPLISAGIETYHLRDEESIVHVCRK
ncbi:MAG: DUF58 domain-containing protein, partial [Pirellulales bacterium]